jgi:hypothetical protein
MEFATKKAAAEQMALQKGWPVRKEYPDGRIIEIMELGVNGMPEYKTTANINAAYTVGTNELWPGGSTGLNLTGAGFTLGMWDGGGVRYTHHEFMVDDNPSRVTQKDSPGGTSDHSTHVAGTLIAEGQIESAQGMAPAANLHAYDWYNEISEMLNANSVDGIILSNHSYTWIRGWYWDGWDTWYWYGDTVISRDEDYLFGFYGQLTKTWDSLAYVMPDYLFVKSAGNARDEYFWGGHYVWAAGLGDWVWSSWPRQRNGGTEGYDCIDNQATAKNLLTVGAVHDIPGGYTWPWDVLMTTYSAWGPTDDGRIKPDIVANGQDLFSSSHLTNYDYSTFSGTSRSSASVCGTLALLQDYYQESMGSYMYADELKALVINTAHAAGGNSPGPDYRFGWGLLNAVGAAELIALEEEEDGHISSAALNSGDTDEFICYCNGDVLINVTIVWIDPPHAALAPALNPITSHLVNDLDVRVIKMSNSTTYYPWKLNPALPENFADTGDNNIDNVEKVTIGNSNGNAGHFKIQVTHKGVLASTQYYGLVVSGMHIGTAGKWVGMTSNDWNTQSNWENYEVPASTTNVTIPAGCANYPVLTGSLGVSYAGTTYLCDNLTINTGGQLTIQNNDLLCAGNIDLDGTMYIGDDATFNNLAVLDLSGSLYTGYNEGWHGLLTMNTGATINQTGGNLYTEEINMASGCQYNGTGGNFRIYKQGYTATQNIQVDDAGSYFYNFYIEDLANAQLVDCSADLDVWKIDVNGSLTLSNYTIMADYANVYGTLTIKSGVVDVLQNGPYFQDGSVFNMSGGELNGNESIRFFTGATENVTGGTITLTGDFYDEDGVFSPSGGSFYFEGSDASNINGPTSFYNLIINKTHPGYDAVENGTGDGNGVDISVDNILQIYDGSFELNSPCTLSVGWGVQINEGAALNANDSPDVLIRLQGSWTNLNLTGGFDAGSNSVLELNAPPGSPGVQIIGDNNLFNDIIINSGAPYVRPSLSTGYGLIHARNIDIEEGVLNLLGEKVIVDETLNIYDQLTMSNAADSLIVGDIIWKPGSYDVVNNGKILVNGSWTWEDGTDASITSGNLVRFIGNTLGFIYSYDANADFYNLDIDKGPSSVWIHTTSTQPVDVVNDMNVFAGCLFHVEYGDLNVNGTLDVQNGATMRLYDGSLVDLDGDFTLNGYVHLNTGGDFYVHGAFQEATTGHINIQSGSFICDKPYFTTRAIQYLYGTLTMSGGTFEITNNHLSLPASFQDNITAGLIRVGGSFMALDNVFQPTGTNTVELINFSGTGSPYVDLRTGNWFINLTVNGNTTWLIGGSGASSLTVKQDLTINSGALQGDTGDLIYLGDDWINNAGNSGFTPGTSHVYLTGSNPTPDRQTISGTTSFYNVTNQSIVNAIEFAGPITVSNIYNADAGGADCETFITGSPININKLILASGAFALSTSAPTVNVSLLDQGGTVQVTNGYLDINDIVETELQGSYTIYNGLIDITQDAGSFLDINADINIAGGEMRLTGGKDVSYWPVSGSHVFTMSGGIMDYKTLGINLQNNNMTYNITGGVIRTVGPFYSLSGVTVFDPVNNEVELYGTVNSNVNVGTGSWFHDLTINKTGATVNATRAFPIKGELDVKSGTFNTNNFLIMVGP